MKHFLHFSAFGSNVSWINVHLLSTPMKRVDTLYLKNLSGVNIARKQLSLKNTEFIAPNGVLTNTGSG